MNLKLLLPIICAAILFDSDLLTAQVVEDETLSTEVTRSGDRDFKVTGGEQRGDNLFHSFAEFSLLDEGSVIFDNNLTIQNIISRVTGNSVSNINGLIQSNGQANLFLINPNGIVFGENAALNIGGSFISTTAESLLFEDGAEFSANLDSSESLLTISTPLGLQFGTNAGAIENRANFSIANPLDPTGESQSKLGLVSAIDRTLALIGSSVNFDGGAITAPSGNIEIISVADDSFVPLESFSEGWKVNHNSVSRFEDIKLDRLASVNATGEGGGSVNIVGRNIQILNGSAIASDTIGSVDGKSIKIDASNAIEINGSDTTGTQVDPFIAGFEIFLPVASKISSNTSGAGNGGDINLTAKNLELTNGGKIELQTFPTSTGDGGNLTIVVDESINLKGARPLLGVGENAANLVLSEIGLDAAIELNQSSQISAVSINSGKAADIEITAQNLRLEDGSLIAVSPFAEGNGGNINLSLSKSLQIIGASFNRNIGSQITANTFADGDAGSINIATDELKIADGGLLLSTSASTGNSGNININADSLQISGIRELDTIPSSISTQTQDSGNGGNIFVNTNSLKISDRANLSVSGSSSGIPGNLIVNADSVELSNSASITAATEFQTGGNIDLNIEERLTLRENSLISAQAFNNADGGNLSIDADFIVAFPQENNDILANALLGNGGNITISTEGIFGLEERNSNPPNLTNDIDASSEFGTAGIVSIFFPTISKIEGELETPNDKLDVESLFKNSFCRVRGKSSFASTGRGGIPRIPDNTILPEHIWSDWRIVESVSPEENESVEEQKTVIPKKLTMIQGWVMDANGNIILTDRPTPVVASQPGFKAPDCNQLNNEKR